MGTSSICHAYSTVSITSKEFTKFQIVLRTWNPSVKLERHCASIRSPINGICNIDFLWSKFPVTILYSLSSKVKLFKGWECLTNLFNVQCLFYPAFPLLASSPSICLSHCPSYYYSVAFQDRCAQVLQLYGNRKLTDPYDPSQSILLSTYNLEMLRQIFMLADKSTLREAMLLFWDEDIAVLGPTKWSTKHSGNNQRGTVKDTRSQVLEAVNISAPVHPLSLSARRSWYKHCSPSAYKYSVLFFRFIYLFWYSLITFHSVTKNSTRTAVGVILNTLWWNVLSPMMPDKCGIDEDFYKQPFVFQ